MLLKARTLASCRIQMVWNISTSPSQNDISELTFIIHEGIDTFRSDNISLLNFDVRSHNGCADMVAKI